MHFAAQFAELRGFTGCVGAIDGTYIRILGPWMRTVAPEEYNTYKKFYATTLLAVADTHLKIRYMNVGWPGSRTDSHILKQSDLYLNPQSYIPSGFYLFGDSGFSQCKTCNSNWLPGAHCMMHSLMHTQRTVSRRSLADHPLLEGTMQAQPMVLRLQL